MRYQLIMLGEPIIVSDENPNGGEVGYRRSTHTVKVMSKDADWYGSGWRKVIAGTPDLPQIDWNGLEEEFGYVDIDKIAENEFDTPNKDFSRIWKHGFMSAQQLNNKKFSKDDIEAAFNTGVNAQFEAKELNKTNTFDFIQSKLHGLTVSISKPKVFDIEIEVEREKATGITDGGIERTFYGDRKPKITDGKIKILRKL